jgi:hypothetical protein
MVAHIQVVKLPAATIQPMRRPYLQESTRVIARPTTIPATVEAMRRVRAE